MVSDIALFFEPIHQDLHNQMAEGTLGAKIKRYDKDGEFPSITKGSVAIFGVSENRRSNNGSDVSDSLTGIRSKLYNLKDHFGELEIYDLGNIGQGETVEDTYYAVTNSVASIIKEGGLAVMLGGSQDLTYANYMAYEKLEQVVNLVSVDSRFDLGDAEDELHSDRFLQKIILHQPNFLFNYSNLGYQTHHVHSKEIDLLKKMYFDVYRLGEVQSDLENVESVVRNADVVSLDMSSIRSSDFPSNLLAEPNGLYGEQACAIARYAGLSDKLSSFGIFNCSSSRLDNRSENLAAQLIWYFIYGVSHRKMDYPFAPKEDYTKYTVTINEGQYDLIFYKSPKSDRWWMEVPYPSKRGAKYQRHFMVPCGYRDYLKACEDEMPDRWWLTYQKLG